MPASCTSVTDAIQRTLEYSNLFQYPLTKEELRERLFDVRVDDHSFEAALKSFQYEPDPALVALRAARQKISDQAIQEARRGLRTLASLPFVRMIAFSGSTAHRNMTTTEDVDLFMIVEDGKVWAVFLVAMVWAKLKGLRKKLCMNYLLSDGAMALWEQDAFTAQQAASLKPIYGKTVYDRFIDANPFVSLRFPNFNPSSHRDVYPEIQAAGSKRLLERILNFGAAQVIERFSRLVLGWYLARKINPFSDVRLDPHRLKLHLHSHKQQVLDSAALDRL